VNGVEDQGRPSFQVVIPQADLQRLRRWGEWAKGAGVLDDYLVALRTINYRLSFEADEWGEPRYTLDHLGLTVRFGTFRMLNVWYGVSAEKGLVFVKVFQFRGDYPRGQPPEA
jgi:hypothetical protein